jgi:hypothetical protein
MTKEHCTLAGGTIPGQSLFLRENGQVDTYNYNSHRFRSSDI